MRFIKYLLLGTFFGIVLAKAEVISWYRIYEMFRFESFHMYGIIGSAVVLGALGIQFIKKNKLRDMYGHPINIADKNMGITRYIAGGTLFGLGWALAGACPGPMFILFGYGYLSIIVVILGAILGTFVYGVVRNRLPH